MSMVDQTVEKENVESAQSLENAISALWEKAREASYLISSLRDEKKRLQSRVSELEGEIDQDKKDIRLMETRIDQLSGELSKNENEGTITLEEEEKKLLQQKIRSAIAKLDQYLS